MSEHSTQLQSLETRIAFLEKHISEQDAEILRLTQRVDIIVKVVRDQKSQLSLISESSGSSGAGSPADERPPHY